MKPEPAADRIAAKTEVRFPYEGAPGWPVAITLSDSPHTYVLTFAEDGAVVDVAVERNGQLLPFTAPLMRELSDRFARLERHARAQLDLMGKKLGTGPRVVRTRREMTPTFLREMAARHAELDEQGLPPTATLAREQGVTTGTVKHWLRRAKELS